MRRVLLFVLFALMVFAPFIVSLALKPLIRPPAPPLPGISIPLATTPAPGARRGTGCPRRGVFDHHGAAGEGGYRRGVPQAGVWWSLGIDVGRACPRCSIPEDAHTPPSEHLGEKQAEIDGNPPKMLTGEEVSALGDGERLGNAATNTSDDWGKQ